MNGTSYYGMLPLICLACGSPAAEIDAPRLVLDAIERKEGAEAALIKHVRDVKGCAISPRSGVCVCAHGKRKRVVLG